MRRRVSALYACYTYDPESNFWRASCTADCKKSEKFTLAMEYQNIDTLPKAGAGVAAGVESGVGAGVGAGVAEGVILGVGAGVGAADGAWVGMVGISSAIATKSPPSSAVTVPPHGPSVSPAKTTLSSGPTAMPLHQSSPGEPSCCVNRKKTTLDRGGGLNAVCCVGCPNPGLSSVEQTCWSTFHRTTSTRNEDTALGEIIQGTANHLPAPDLFAVREQGYQGTVPPASVHAVPIACRVPG